jgi:lipopolysaccharide transport system ATP-binding protein
MVARLGFSVATANQPDILIVDEVLSVGDEAFQEKCSERIRQYQQNGTTIVIVSHSMGTINKMCHRAAWFDHGTIQTVGDPETVIHTYRERR